MDIFFRSWASSMGGPHKGITEAMGMAKFSKEERERGGKNVGGLLTFGESWEMRE